MKITVEELAARHKGWRIDRADGWYAAHSGDTHIVSTSLLGLALILDKYVARQGT
jgi:hypothetical protein